MKLYGYLSDFIPGKIVDLFGQVRMSGTSTILTIHRMCPASYVHASMRSAFPDPGSGWAGKKWYGKNPTWQNTTFTICGSEDF